MMKTNTVLGKVVRPLVIVVAGLAVMACSARPPMTPPSALDVPGTPARIEAAAFEADAIEVAEVGPPLEVAPSVEPVVEETPVPEDPIVTYTLRRGESLAHFARWAELPVETIADASERGLDEALPVGTIIRVPADVDMRSRIEFRRDAHHERRVEGYLASRGGSLNTTFHVVRTGDSAWSIAKENGRLPVWVVEAFNPSLDLEALLPGQSVMLPVTADMEPAAEPDAVSMVEEPELDGR